MAKAGVAYIDVEGNFNPFSQGLDGVLRQLGSRFTAFGGIGGTALAGISAGAIGVGVGLFKIGQSFNAAFDTIRVGTGQTGSALRGLENDFKEVVKDVPTDFGSASEAIAAVNARLHLTGAPLQDVTERLLELSRLTKSDLTGNLESVTRLFGDWSISTDKQSGVLDELFRASQRTGIGVQNLAERVVFFGAPLRQLGFGFTDAIALISKFEAEGVNVETVLGGMRMGLARLAKAGEEPASTFRRLVGEIKAFGDAGDIIKSNEVAIKLFGARAGPDLAAAIREGRFEVSGLAKDIASGKDTILGAAGATNDFSEKWLQFKNRVLVALEPVARKFFNAFGKFLDDAGPALAGFMSIVAKLAPVLTPIIVPLLAIAAAALPIGILAKGVLGVVKAFGLLYDIIKLTWLLVSLNPWVLLVAAAVAAIVLIVTHWEEFKRGLSIIWEFIKTAAADAWNWIKDFFSKWWPVILGIFTGGIGLIVGLIIQNWTAIKAWTIQAFNDIVNFITGVPGMILNALASLAAVVWGAIVGAFEAAFNGAVSTLLGLVNFVAGIPGAILGAVGDLAGLLFDSGRRLIEGLWNGIQSAAGWLRDKVKGLVDSIVGFFKNPLGIFSPSKVFAELGKEIPAGVALGIAQATRGGAVSRAVAAIVNPDDLNVVARARPFAPPGLAVAAAAIAQTPASRVVHLNINGPITIRNEDDLVKLRRGLAREVERQDRAQGVTTP